MQNIMIVLLGDDELEIDIDIYPNQCIQFLAAEVVHVYVRENKGLFI